MGSKVQFLIPVAFLLFVAVLVNSCGSILLSAPVTLPVTSQCRIQTIILQIGASNGIPLSAFGERERARRSEIKTTTADSGEISTTSEPLGLRPLH